MYDKKIEASQGYSYGVSSGMGSETKSGASGEYLFTVLPKLKFRIGGGLKITERDGGETREELDIDIYADRVARLVI